MAGDLRLDLWGLSEVLSVHRHFLFLLVFFFSFSVVEFLSSFSLLFQNSIIVSLVSLFILSVESRRQYMGAADFCFSLFSLNRLDTKY